MTYVSSLRSITVPLIHKRNDLLAITLWNRTAGLGLEPVHKMNYVPSMVTAMADAPLAFELSSLGKDIPLCSVVDVTDSTTAHWSTAIGTGGFGEPLYLNRRNKSHLERFSNEKYQVLLIFDGHSYN